MSLVLALLVTFQTNGDFKFVLTDEAVVNLLPYTGVMKDSRNKIPDNHVIEGAYRDSLAEVRPSSSIGYSTAAWWFQIILENAADKAREYILVLEDPRLDYVTFLELEGRPGPTTRVLRKVTTGDRYPVSTRPVPHRHFVLPIHFSAFETKTILVKVKSESSISAPLTLYTREGRQSRNKRDQLIIGGFIGLMIGMVVYNFLVGLMVRERLFFYFVVTTFFFAATLLIRDGWAFVHLWPNHPNWANQCLMYSLLVTLWLAFLFLVDSLQLDRYLPKAMVPVRISYTFLFALLLFHPLLSYSMGHRLALVLLLTYVMISLICLVLRCFQGSKTALFLLLGWGSCLLFIGIQSLGLFGVFSNSMQLNHGLMLSTTLGAVFLSFVLGRRINQFRLHQSQALKALEEANRNLEERVEERTTYLRTTKELLENIIGNLPHSVFWKDRNSVYQGGNMNFAREAGLNHADELVGKTDFDFAWKDEEAEFFRTCDRQVMDSGVPLVNIEEPQQQADGKQATLLTSKVPLRDARGDVVGLLGMYIDISKRKELEDREKQRTKELARINAELKEKNAAILSSQEKLIVQEKTASLGRMLSGLAHEIRNPLNFIENLSSDELVEEVEEFLQQEGGDLGAASRSFFEEAVRDLKRNHQTIQKHAKRLSNLTSTMTALSDRGNINNRTEPIDFNKLVRTFLDMSLASKGVNGMEPNVALDPKIGKLDFNINHLGRICTSLFNNAVESMEIRGERDGRAFQPRWRIATKDHGSKLELHVVDNGVGIPESIRGRIFDPLFTTKSSTKGHVGMGLAICYSLVVERNNGEIDLSSNEDQTSFTVVLPRHGAI